MPVLFSCPHCNAETVVDDAYGGQSGPCATCGRMVTVPAAGSSGVRTIVQRAAGAGLGLGSIGLLIGVVAGSLVVGALVIGVAVAILAPAVQSARASSLKLKSAEKLQLIAQAMQAYHTDYGVYPPAYLTDGNGKPKHSWRVLILPYLGERQLYQQYDMNQAWDSPTNMALVSRMPSVYASPGDDSASTSYETSYMVVVGRATVFPGGDKSLNMNQITDSPGNTILVVESTESGVNWMEPKDLTASSMEYAVNGAATNCIRSHHPYGAQVVFADGKTHYLTNDLPPEYIEALTTAAKQDHAPLDALGDE